MSEFGRIDSLLICYKKIYREYRLTAKCAKGFHKGRKRIWQLQEVRIKRVVAPRFHFNPVLFFKTSLVSNSRTCFTIWYCNSLGLALANPNRVSIFGHAWMCPPSVQSISHCQNEVIIPDLSWLRVQLFLYWYRGHRWFQYHISLQKLEIMPVIAMYSSDWRVPAFWDHSKPLSTVSIMPYKRVSVFPRKNAPGRSRHINIPLISYGIFFHPSSISAV